MHKTLRRLLLATLALSLLALPALAGDAHIEEIRKVKLKVLAGDELIDLDLSDLEVGESQQMYAADGTQIVATRNEDSYTIQVGDEEEIVVPTNIGHGNVEIESGDGHHVIVRKEVHSADGNGAHAVFISGDGDAQHIEIDEDVNHWVSASGDGNAMAHVIRMERKDPAQHLIESGVLDDLDETTRQKILDELRKIEPAHKLHTTRSGSKIVIRKHGDDEEEEDLQ